MHKSLAIIIALSSVHLSSAVLPLQDATAYIDHLFTYQIDPQDFAGAALKIAESGGGEIPNWLHWDEKSFTLKGVPSIKDKGTHILAVGADLSKAQDVFAITVTNNPRQEVAQPSQSKEPAIICKPHESVTVVNVMLNTDHSLLDAVSKIRLVEGIVNHLSLLPKHITLKPHSSDLSHSSPLVAGPGDSKLNPLSTGSVFSWVVGCGSVKSHQVDLLEQLEQSAKDGSLSASLGHGVVGWQVTSNKQKMVNGRRLKRALVTPTPTPSSSATIGGQSPTASGKITPTVGVVTPTATTVQTPKESTVTSTAMTTATTRSTTRVLTPPTPPPSPSILTTTKKPSTPAPVVVNVETPITTVSLLSSTTRKSPTASTSTTPATTTPQPPTTTRPIIKPPPLTPPPITSPPPPQNKAPVLNEELISESHEAYTGELFKWSVPHGLFTDEDEVLTMTLLEITGRNVNDGSWIRLDGDTVIGVPMNEVLGKNMFTLRATDTRGRYADMQFEVDVTKSKAVASVNQVYHISIAEPFKGRQHEILQLVYQLVQDQIMSNILVSDVRHHIDGVAVLLGEVVSKPQRCPTDAHRATLSRLRDNLELEDGKGNSWKFNYVLAEPKPPCNNTKPYVNRRVIDKFQDIKILQGQMYTQVLPEDLFLDYEQIDLRFMTIELIANGVEKDIGWISLDSATRTLVALTLDIPSPYQYSYRVDDNHGGEFEHSIAVDVAVPYGEPTHVFKVMLDMSYSVFTNDRLMIREVYKLLNASFPTASVVMERIVDGSVVVEWHVTNNRLIKLLPSVCPVDDIQGFQDSVYEGHGHNIKDSFVSSLQKFNLKQLDFDPRGPCVGALHHLSCRVAPRAEPDKDRNNDQTNLLAIVIPVVIILLLIIILVTVGIVIIMRKRNQTLEVSRNNGTYIEKGVPVVFDEEMKDVGQREPGEGHRLLEDTDMPEPPAYPGTGKNSRPLRSEEGEDERYHPPTPPVSEPEEGDKSV